MPIEPVISLEQIIITIAFLMILFALMWFVRRYRSGISSHIHPDRRMQHIEDLSLAPQQRLHLIEVDGRAFLVHAGKGHAASFIAVDGEVVMTRTHPRPPPQAAQQKKLSPKTSCNRAGGETKSTFAAAFAQARRKNPSLEFGK